jgi:tRNA A-37 threonylcarbamoyl transferase component Bud32
MPLLRAVGSDEIVLDAITGQNGYDLINTDRAADILFAAGRLLRKLHEVSTGAVPTLQEKGV